MFWGGYEHGPAHVPQTDPARPPGGSSTGELGPNACFLGVNNPSLLGYSS